MMFGPKLNTVFASRWKALMWAAGVLIGAYFSIPDADDSKDEASNSQVIAALAPLTK